MIAGDILRQVTQYISNSPAALSSSLPFDEVSLVAKINQHVSEKSTKVSTSLVATSRGNNNNSPTNATLFINLYDELKASVRYLILVNCYLVFNKCKKLLSNLYRFIKLYVCQNLIYVYFL